MNLSEYRTAIRQTINDTSAVRYPDALIDQGLRLALQEYSDACPQVLTAESTIGTTARDQVLTSLSGSAIGLQDVVEVFYPYTSGQTDPSALESYYRYNTGGSPALYVGNAACMPPLPMAGNKFLIRYTASQTIQDLDGAALTTVKVEHQTTLVYGAVAHSLFMRANGMIEAFGSPASDTNQMMNWASNLFTLFHARLDQLRAESVRSRGPFGGMKWRQDEWDNGRRF